MNAPTAESAVAAEPESAATTEEHDGDTSAERDDTASSKQPRRVRIMEAVRAVLERDDNRRVLDDLIQLRYPVRIAVRCADHLRLFPDPFGRPLATFGRADVRRVLSRYRHGDMQWDEVRAWATAVLTHINAPVDRPFVALEPGARPDLTVALAVMRDPDEPKSRNDFGFLWALTHEDAKRALDQPWCAAVGMALAIGLCHAAQAVWDLPPVVPRDLRVIGALAIAIPAASVFFAWATSGLHAAGRQVEFWSVLVGIGVVLAAVFDFGAVT